MSTTVNHHFIPQFYLRGFSDSADRRKAQVFVFDKSLEKVFRTKIRNIGARRNFFRVDAEGFDPNHVEDGMAEIEGTIAPHLADVIKTKSFPSDEHFTSVMILMRNMALRNPRFRSTIEDFHVRIATKLMDLSLQDKDRFQDSIRKARAQGAPIRDDISYEEMKEFIDRGEYKIAIDQTYLVALELNAVPRVVYQLARRNWFFVSSSTGKGFITCDDPVVLDWADGIDRGIYSPGFGVNETVVMFPLSPEVALMGLIGKQPPSQAIRRDQVANINTAIAKHATSQLYARDGEFEVNTRARMFTLGKDLPITIGQQLNEIAAPTG